MKKGHPCLERNELKVVRRSDTIRILFEFTPMIFFVNTTKGSTYSILTLNLCTFFSIACIPTVSFRLNCPVAVAQLSKMTKHHRILQCEY